MLNINKGCNQELLAKCQALQGYCIFVDTIRRYSRLFSIEEAVIKAVDECIENNVLRDFLTSQKAKVIQMSIYEFDIVNEIKKLRKSEYNYGVDVGRQEGREEGREEERAKGAAGIIQICMKSGVSQEDALKTLMESFSIGEQEALCYLNKYWIEK